MKFFHYIFRNARRNPVRSLLTVASTSICLFLMMILLSFISINDEVSKSFRADHRIVVMNAQGFAGMVPISRVREVAALDGVRAASPLNWYGGKFGEERMPFAQFGCDPQTIFSILDELTIPEGQLRAFQEDKAGCVIGRKLAEEYHLKLGDPMPLKGDLFPVDLELTIKGIYDGPFNRDRKMCLFHWDYFDEKMKRDMLGRQSSGNAGIIYVKCKNADVMAGLSRKIDAMYANTDASTKTQTEEAFGKMFSEMLGDLGGMVRNIGLAVVFSLMCVAGNAMAMSLRERTTEIAVLKAIGFGKQRILFLVLAEAMLVAGLGGLLGTVGSKLLCDVVDLARFSGGFLPFFYIPWSTALLGLAVALAIGFVSGLVPAVSAAQLSVVRGLRKVA